MGDADDWRCAICLELLYKPCINTCGHAACFWWATHVGMHECVHVCCIRFKLCRQQLTGTWAQQGGSEARLHTCHIFDKCLQRVSPGVGKVEHSLRPQSHYMQRCVSAASTLLRHIGIAGPRLPQQHAIQYPLCQPMQLPPLTSSAAASARRAAVCPPPNTPCLLLLTLLLAVPRLAAGACTRP